MIQDGRVLQDDFLPQEVVHRHEEMNRLSAALDPVVDGGRPEDALVVGPSGAGKTRLARYAVSELEREADIETQYVDCWQHSSRFRILYRILEGVAPTHDIHRSTPRDELAPSARLLRSVHIARAFTAYQHHALTERVVTIVSPRTGCLVVPNAASLYRDDDVPAHEAEPLCSAVMNALGEVATAFEIPVLVTDAGPDDALADVLAEHAERELRCERTELGYRYEGEDFETTVYWQDGYRQTTIPYWMELLGTAHGTDGVPTAPNLEFAW